jgi:phospholipid-binding lipoprotein MlaA
MTFKVTTQRRYLIRIVFFLLCFGFFRVVNASDDVTITMEQLAQASSNFQDESSLDWRNTDWKDPFTKNIKFKTPLNSKTSVNSNLSSSEPGMTLELEFPTSAPIVQSDLFEDLEDPFASKLNTPDMPDPFEGYNRFMFDFNEGFYESVMEPVVRGYSDLVHENIRMGIANIFDNATAPLKLASSFLQGDLDKTARVIGRTLINTTLGLGGIFDVASNLGVEDVNEDLDQTLGAYGLPTGPYIVLPFFGPSYARNIVGRVGGGFLSPTLHFAPGFEVSASLSMTDQLNDTSFIVDDIEQMEDSTLDKYESVRDFYGQYRNGLVNK